MEYIRDDTLLSDDDFDLDDDVDDDRTGISPFNLDDVPVAQEVDEDDAVPQEAIFDGLFLHQEGAPSDGPTWEQTPVSTLNLSSIERMFRVNDRSSAIKLLHRRINLVLDPDLKLRSDDPTLLWQGSKHFLDFILVVSSQIGLQAFLPKTVADHNFSMTLNLRLQCREFRPKFGKLGFDPTGSMMAIGDGQSTELWLGFSPVANVEDIDIANDCPLLSEKHGDTRLTSVHYRMGVMFLASCLSQIPSLPVHVMFPYGPHSDFKDWKIEDATNVLCVSLYVMSSIAFRVAFKVTSSDVGCIFLISDQRVIVLRLQDVLLLDRIIQIQYDDFVANAPDSWLRDGWLQQHIPISVACRYGQNQPIASNDRHALRVEARNWSHERDYTDIRYLSMAIATHISCMVVSDWVEIPVDDILSIHEVVYNSPDSDVRRPVDLHSLPLREPETEKEINVYDEEGRRIPRFHGRSRVDGPKCGLLVDLETIPQLFSSDVAHDEHLDLDVDILDFDEEHGAKIKVYPQAFLRKFGHLQSNTILPHFKTFIKKVQANITRGRRGPNGMDDGDDNDDVDNDVGINNRNLIPPAIIATGCQFYNEVSHRVRPNAGLHEVQQGRITSALSGAYARGTGTRVHTAIMYDCRLHLPHHRYNNSIKADNVPRDLRLENIYILQLDSMDPAKRNGMSIYLDVIVPLARAWSHPHVCDALRPHLAVFVPRAFPQIYQWMTFGITSLLERIWEHQLPLLNLNKKPSPQMIEMCAMLERALAYAHTGNAKVLSSSLMKPFWLIRSLLQQGCPTFAPTIRIIATTTRPVSISPADWPIVSRSNLPAIASKRSQVITYGLDHFEASAYKAEFHIQLSVHNPSPTVFMQYDQDLRHAIIIAVVAFQSFIADIKTLVSVGITKICVDLENQDTHSSSLEAKIRRLNLKKWLASKYPLSYIDRAFEYLLRAIVGDSGDYGLGLPNPTQEKLSIRDFAKLLVDMSRPTGPVPIAAPLISNSSSPMVFRVALIYMSKFVPRDSPNAANLFLHNAFIIGANHLHINNIPWHLAGGRGRRYSKPHFESWINLGKAAQLPTAKSLASQTTNGAAEASQRAQASDTRAAWAACSITLQSLPDFLSRTVPPDEFCMDSVTLDKSDGKDSIVHKTYQWAFAEFDMSRPLHQLAILVGVYVSKLIPDLFYDMDNRPDHESYHTMFAFTKAVREMPWISNSRRKGCKIAAQFVAMVPVYIMAVFDRSSPLHDHFERTKSFPTAWTKKHSNKGIGPLLLIRMGLASARSGRIWKGGIFNVDWSILTRDEVGKLHQKIIETLRDRQFGPYRVGQILFGSAQAQTLGMKTYTYTVNPGIASTSLGKRATSSITAADEADDEIEIFEMGAPAARRRRIR
ncbi:hypothetical protein EV702DRAFT_1283003 [Suillus placidus]|uniref:DUF8190 domain-containing protein n=1 Tax=Suillus placidus TaxID=48579 RepID=A0A9P6ZH27_9AGAM|nr:hypothetical protein EV702DRAFT_1283003 [Suillus placidus]